MLHIKELRPSECWQQCSCQQVGGLNARAEGNQAVCLFRGLQKDTPTIRKCKEKKSRSTEQQMPPNSSTPLLPLNEKSKHRIAHLQLGEEKGGKVKG